MKNLFSQHLHNYKLVLFFELSAMQFWSSPALIISDTLLFSLSSNNIKICTFHLVSSQCTIALTVSFTCIAHLSTLLILCLYVSFLCSQVALGPILIVPVITKISYYLKVRWCLFQWFLVMDKRTEAGSNLVIPGLWLW